MARIEVFPGLEAASYKPHGLHLGEAIWVEKNCYADLWIELLHAMQLEPSALLPFTFAVDFEDDQWTFFKPPFEDLRDLYGIDVQEMTVWQPMIDHAVLHLRGGKLISWEADAFWLPDTAATDYRRNHVKTTIVLASLDLAAGKLGYFHNAGFHELKGEDFRNLFRLDAAPDPTFMPLYAELIRLDRLVRKPIGILAGDAFRLLRRWHGLRPFTNPVERFAKYVDKDFARLQAGGLALYHQWAFANLRQAGASYELAGGHLRWQARFGHEPLVAAAECFEAIATGMKALVLKGARAANAGKPLDTTTLHGDLAAAWDRGMGLIATYLDRRSTGGTA